MRNLKPLFLFVASGLIFYQALLAQENTSPIYINDKGVMYDASTKQEIQGFGVNYTLPFAHAYRMALQAGVSPEEAIRQDIYHMARLDLDLFRVHVWDTEISDTLGNLLENEHLQLFDFMLSELQKRDIQCVLTPIAYWGNGWPEPDEPSPGFSNKYGKDACLTNTEAIEAQARYLYQFLNHVNVYTGVAYKDDPNIIAFEVSNEPHHHEAPEKITSFINKMVASMRETGCKKPIFYNVSQEYENINAYLAGSIDGVTFQWYPTNLVANHAIKGNFLPQVQSYAIPFADDPVYKKMAKIVYEFDPADVSGNILYPAMALSFREAGMQLATHFAYDALCRAAYNTNYGTHFMNLAYAPQKALSLKIASAIFHQVPLYEKVSDRNHFQGFHIAYADDLVEWVSKDKFFYTNNTLSQPESTTDLQEIAGYGSSPLVVYTGSGAYFLDKLAKGVWRLELMPDAYWIKDPYSPVDPQEQKAAVHHAVQQMKVYLPDLSSDFTVRAIDKEQNYSTRASDGSFSVVPGVYLLQNTKSKKRVSASANYKNISVNEYVAPASDLQATVLQNLTPDEVLAGGPLQLKVQIASPEKVNKVYAVSSNNNVWKNIDLLPEGNAYHADVPVELCQHGYLTYQLIVETASDTFKFPGGYTGNPWRWDNTDQTTFTTVILPEQSPLCLWDAETDWDASYKTWYKQVNLKPSAQGSTALSLVFDSLPSAWPLDPGDRSYAFKFYFKDKVAGRYAELTQKKYVVVQVENKRGVAQSVEIGFTDKNGNTQSVEAQVEPGVQKVKVAMNLLTDAAYVVLPRPYPDFIPYRVKVAEGPFEKTSLEMLQVELKQEEPSAVNLLIEKIWME